MKKIALVFVLISLLLIKFTAYAELSMPFTEPIIVDDVEQAIYDVFMQYQEKDGFELIICKDYFDVNYEVKSFWGYCGKTLVIPISIKNTTLNHRSYTIDIKLYDSGKIINSLNTHFDNLNPGEIATNVISLKDAAIDDYKLKISVCGKTQIMGESIATVEQLKKYLKRHNPQAPDIAHYYIEEGEKEGVRGDIAFAQAIKETGYFKFNAICKMDWHNPAGLGVTGKKDANGEYYGNRFPDWQTGIRAHIQHLKAYACTDTLNNECVDLRFNLVRRGVAPYWEDLNGRWAIPGEHYGEDIIKIWKDIISQ